MHNPTPGPWDFVPATENHGPYVTSDFGNTICDLYVMSEPTIASDKPRHPVSFMAGMAEPNARLIAAAPELLEALQEMVTAAGGVGLDAVKRRKKALAQSIAAIAKARGGVA